MGMVEPSGAGVVEIGESAFFQFLRGSLVLGQDAVGIAFDHFGHSLDKLRRVEPVLAQLVEPRRRCRNSLRAWIIGVALSG